MIFENYERLVNFINENTNSETRNCEFKSANKWEGDFKYKIVRAILCMANKRDGGSIIIGVDEDKKAGTFNIKGLSSADASSYKNDEVLQFVNEKFADPSVNLTVQKFENTGEVLVNIHVSEFENEPIICKGDYTEILQKGRIYSRGHNKPECTPNLTSEDLREILDIAKTKSVANEIQKLQSFGIIPKHGSTPQQSKSQSTDNAQYEEEAKDFDN